MNVDFLCCIQSSKFKEIIAKLIPISWVQNHTSHVVVFKFVLEITNFSTELVIPLSLVFIEVNRCIPQIRGLSVIIRRWVSIFEESCESVNFLPKIFVDDCFKEITHLSSTTILNLLNMKFCKEEHEISNVHFWISFKFCVKFVKTNFIFVCDILINLFGHIFNNFCTLWTWHLSRNKHLLVKISKIVYCINHSWTA